MLYYRPMIEIRKTTYHELSAAKTFSRLTAEYATESAIMDLPTPNHVAAIYQSLDKSEAFHFFGVYEEPLHLVGFGTFVLMVSPHYGVPVATIETVFVSKEHRKGGAGVKLLRHMEREAMDRGAVAIMVNGPIDGGACRAFRGMGFKPTHTVMTKRLA